MTVEELIKELKKFPKDAEVTAYEGEAVGITIYSKNNESGFIYTGANKDTELLIK
ncbi:hypothetical protein [Thiospirochaeta perfilievii]|uniref:hypothetical protein n=1 Tax=Thiospirochaeta perfilievii TaxID=252967 RepID=UPI001658F700|nr:hypothetical protein [Thiospirochaeta perfilievii]